MARNWPKIDSAEWSDLPAYHTNFSFLWRMHELCSSVTALQEEGQLEGQLFLCNLRSAGYVLPRADSRKAVAQRV